MVIHSSVSESAYSVPGTILGTVRDRALVKQKIPALGEYVLGLR